jgi:hypothetical protein
MSMIIVMTLGHHTPCLKAGACTWPPPPCGSETDALASTVEPRSCGSVAVGRGDRCRQPLHSHVGTPYTERSTQVVLAYKSFDFMPICTCCPVRPIEVSIDHKQFLPTSGECLCAGLDVAPYPFFSTDQKAVTDTPLPQPQIRKSHFPPMAPSQGSPCALRDEKSKGRRLCEKQHVINEWPCVCTNSHVPVLLSDQSERRT